MAPPPTDDASPVEFVPPPFTFAVSPLRDNQGTGAVVGYAIVVDFPYGRLVLQFDRDGFHRFVAHCQQIVSGLLVPPSQEVEKWAKKSI